MNGSLTESDFPSVLVIDGSEQSADFEFSNAQRRPQHTHQLVLCDRTVLFCLEHLKAMHTSHLRAEHHHCSDQLLHKTWHNLLVFKRNHTPWRPTWWCLVFLQADTPQRTRSQTLGHPLSCLHATQGERKDRLILLNWTWETANVWKDGGNSKANANKCHTRQLNACCLIYFTWQWLSYVKYVKDRYISTECCVLQLFYTIKEPFTIQIKWEYSELDRRKLDFRLYSALFQLISMDSPHSQLVSYSLLAESLVLSFIHTQKEWKSDCLLFFS